MIIWGFIVLTINIILWFLAGSTYNNKAVLGSVYGPTWQMIFLIAALLGLVLIVLSRFIKNHNR